MQAIITSLDQLQRGEYTRETIVDVDKCDVPARLRDGRLLLLECKVSNSAVNSLKRLNDVIKKAQRWRDSFGRGMCITAAVLSGVYKVDHLFLAQRDVCIFWERDLNLGALRQFVEDAK